MRIKSWRSFWNLLKEFTRYEIQIFCDFYCSTFWWFLVNFTIFLVLRTLWILEIQSNSCFIHKTKNCCLVFFKIQTQNFLGVFLFGKLLASFIHWLMISIEQSSKSSVVSSRAFFNHSSTLKSKMSIKLVYAAHLC